MPVETATSGFIPRVDVRTVQGTVTRVLRGQAGKWYSQINLGLQALRTEDHDGRRTDQSVALDAPYNGRASRSSSSPPSTTRRCTTA